MSPKEQLIAAAIGILVAALPVVYASLKLLIAYVQLKQLEVEQAKAARLKQAATEAVYYAAEKGAAEGLPGSARAKVACDLVADKLPHASDDDIEVAVRAAVGAAPGLGASGKPAPDGGGGAGGGLVLIRKDS